MTAGDSHPSVETLQRYSTDTMPSGALAALEAHLESCGPCRGRLEPWADLDAVERIRVRLDKAMDTPAVGRVERWLTRFGVPDHTARLMAATPALAVSWGVAAALALVGAALTARLTETDGTPFAFLALAPLLPVAGVAVSYGRRWDPAYEMALAAPVNGIRILLLRTSVVLGTCLVLSAGASLILPSPGLATLAWLMPSCALTATTLALSARMDPLVGAGAVAGGWLALLLSTWHARTFDSLTGQGLMATLLIMAVIVLITHRSAFDAAKGKEHP